MPAKRKDASSEEKPKATGKKPKKEQGASSDGDVVKTGPWTPDEERLFFLLILAKTDFKLTKEIQDEAARTLGRSSKAIDNFWYMKVSKQVKELQRPRGGDVVKAE